MMPIARYFLFAGGALLALLFAFDLFSPKAVADIGIHSGAGVDKSTVRIRSDQKWPERVVFDTTQPTIVPKAAQTKTAQIEPATAAPEFTATARVRETFAQFVPVEPKKPEATTTVKKRKVVRHNQPMRFAQQRYGFFGPTTW